MSNRFSRPLAAAVATILSVIIGIVPAQAVENGRVSTNPSVARIYIDETMCSGTLISPTAVLTAKHCIPKVAKKNAVVINKKTLHFTNVALHPTADLAVITLTTPSDSQPLPLSGVHQQPGAKGTVIGAGFFFKFVPESTNYAANATVDGLAKVHHVVSNMVEDEPLLKATITGGTLQQGDSGGPLLINGKIAGVTSRTDSLIGGAITFGGMGLFAPVAQYVDWISRMAHIQPVPVSGTPSEPITIIQPD